MNSCRLGVLRFGEAYAVRIARFAGLPSSPKMGLLALALVLPIVACLVHTKAALGQGTAQGQAAEKDRK
ncbi:MAG: hypothetical protein QXN56_05075, partial [Candidatus Hadarchaeum sp.]